MNVEQQDNERFSARASMENNVNIKAAIKGYTRYEMDDKLCTTNVIVEVLVEIVTGFQKKPECDGVKAAFLLIVLSKESDDKKMVKLRAILLAFPVPNLIHKTVDSTWSFTVTCNEHNHEPSTSKNAHPTHTVFQRIIRRKNPGLFQYVLKARHIQTTMRERDSQLNNSKRKLWNLKQKHAIMKLDGRTPMDKLYAAFKESGFEIDVQKDIDGNITHLFFAQPKNVELLRNNCDVLLVDCTYKSSKTRFSLLHVVGNTMLYSTFSVAFAFMKNEDNNSQIIAINFIRRLLQDNHLPKVFVIDRELALMDALQITFPSASILLCIWHIEKNVVAKCKPQFAGKNNEEWKAFSDGWRTVAYSNTIEKFEENWKEFQTIWSVRYENAVEYLAKTWIDPHKEKFALP
uniref:Uncharacterized protein AlNc14C155G7630 n=1 Tax=Albugo laibachii Nc14 TaxID=890382 RepID=F0WMD1_9STRA|nr:hypothetical protein CHGG_03237 [Albugo laibachii Nc14]|eukprot:CCA22462.1 hypothetical protein CHGG_03237 [Albugo laibachii Nc14]